MIHKRFDCFGNFAVIHGILLAAIVTVGTIVCNTAQAEDYRSLIVTTLISTGGDTVPTPPTPPGPPTPGPVPIAQCVVCKGTGFITHGDGHKTPCPEDHASARAAREFAAQLAAGDVGDKEHPDWDRDAKIIKTDDDGCQCESGGPCTCNGDCDCAECACDNCPGKTSKTVLLQVCDALGCRMVKAKATRKDGFWYAEGAGRWHIWKGGKWQKIRAADDGTYRIERPVIKPMLWKAQKLEGPFLLPSGRLLPSTRAPGQHSHRCGMCSHTWSHYPGQSHRCPSCGGLTSQNYVQINSGRSYQRPVMRQPRRMFASRGG